MHNCLHINHFFLRNNQLDNLYITDHSNIISSLTGMDNNNQMMNIDLSHNFEYINLFNMLSINYYYKLYNLN